MIKTAQDIIVAPVITEKSSGEMVTGVNVASYDGKLRRQRYQLGRTPAFKKAVVTIDTEGKEVSYLGKGGKAVKVSKKYKTSIEDFGFGV